MNCADFATVSMAALSMAWTIVAQAEYSLDESGARGPDANGFEVNARKKTQKAPNGASGLQTDSRTVFGDGRFANAFYLNKLVDVFEGAVLIPMGDYRFGFFQTYAV